MTKEELLEKYEDKITGKYLSHFVNQFGEAWVLSTEEGALLLGGVDVDWEFKELTFSGGMFMPSYILDQDEMSWLWKEVRKWIQQTFLNLNVKED